MYLGHIIPICCEGYQEHGFLACSYVCAGCGVRNTKKKTLQVAVGRQAAMYLGHVVQIRCGGH
jgi:uncharacterized protein (DUF983 family)